MGLGHVVWDLQQPCNTLARDVSKWNKNGDIELNKLDCYIKGTKRHCLQSWIGDPVEVLRLVCYVDVDFASGLRSPKSISGATSALIGPSSFFSHYFYVQEAGVCIPF